MQDYTLVLLSSAVTSHTRLTHVCKIPNVKRRSSQELRMLRDGTAAPITTSHRETGMLQLGLTLCFISWSLDDATSWPSQKPAISPSSTPVQVEIYNGGVR